MARTQKKLILYGLFLGAVVLLLFFPPPGLERFKFAVIRVASMPSRWLAAPVLEIKKLLFYHRTYDEYQRLRQEVRTLKARLAGMDEVVRENSRLEKLLEFRRQVVYSSVTANVVERDPTHWNSALVIDKGTRDGVAPGMPVVNASGVVGKVFEVDTERSKVMLVTDPAFSVVALAQRSREVGLISGTLQGLCRMKYLSSEADVQAGDTILTSKLSSTFPEGLMIGEVTAVYRREDLPTVECLVKPAVPLSQIEEVLVIQTPSPI